MLNITLMQVPGLESCIILSYRYTAKTRSTNVILGSPKILRGYIKL